jgi:hypothetical protein
MPQLQVQRPAASAKNVLPQPTLKAHFHCIHAPPTATALCCMTCASFCCQTGSALDHQLLPCQRMQLRYTTQLPTYNHSPAHKLKRHSCLDRSSTPYKNASKHGDCTAHVHAPRIATLLNPSYANIHLLLCCCHSMLAHSMRYTPTAASAVHTAGNNSQSPCTPCSPREKG